MSKNTIDTLSEMLDGVCYMLYAIKVIRCVFLMLTWFKKAFPRWRDVHFMLPGYLRYQPEIAIL